MGQHQTKHQKYYIPSKKLFKMSYCIQENISESITKKEYVDLSKLVEGYEDIGLMLQFIYYKLKHEGYSFKEYSISQITYRLDQIFDYINDNGIFLSNNSVINDFRIIKKCYEPNLNNIYFFLNKGQILLGGIILDEKFITDVLHMEIGKNGNGKNSIISDIVLIIGYDENTIYLKTEWCENTVKIDNKFVSNIREIWNIEIKTFY